MSNISSSFKIDQGRLIIHGEVIKLPCQVSKVIDDGQTLFVMIDSEKGRVPDRNVYAVRPDGTIKWIIEDFDFDKTREHPFTNIWFEETGELMAYNWVGYKFYVDIETGKITLWKDPETGEVPRPW